MSRFGRVMGALVFLAMLAFFYFFPRIIVHAFGEASPWTSYLYLYGNGLIVFLVGLWLILRSGACQFGRGHDTRWFIVLMAGFVYYAAIHAIWILAALYVPVKGAL